MSMNSIHIEEKGQGKRNRRQTHQNTMAVAAINNIVGRAGTTTNRQKSVRLASTKIPTYLQPKKEKFVTSRHAARQISCEMTESRQQQALNNSMEVIRENYVTKARSRHGSVKSMNSLRASSCDSQGPRTNENAHHYSATNIDETKHHKM